MSDPKRGTILLIDLSRLQETTEQWVHGSLGSVQHLSKGLQFSDNNLADHYDLGLSAPNAERLEKIRTAYDPDGLFRTYLAPD